MLNITTVTQLITQLRAATQAGSVTPETVGSILQKMADLIGSVDVFSERDRTTLTSITAGVAKLTDMLGKPGGIARLDNSGAIPAECLPDLSHPRQLPHIIPFGFIDERTTVNVNTMSFGDAPDISRIVWLSAKGVFGYQDNTAIRDYYSNWTSADDYMDTTRKAPLTDRLYSCQDHLYRIVSGKLTQIL